MDTTTARAMTNEEVEKELEYYGIKRFATSVVGKDEFRIGFVDWFSFQAIAKLSAHIHSNSHEGIDKGYCVNCGEFIKGKIIPPYVVFSRHGCESVYVHFMLCKKCFKALRPYLHVMRNASKFMCAQASRIKKENN